MPVAEWEAPAKLNLDLRLRPADARGKHPLRSLVQTIEWVDVLRLEVGDEDQLDISGAAEGIPEGGENLVWKAVTALGLDSRPPLFIALRKEIAAAAGLGGGSSNAAAMLMAVADLLGVSGDRVEEAARDVGADVPLFLGGGTAVIEGYGERVTPVAALTGFAVAVVVPPFELATTEVYSRWDVLDAPVGAEVPTASLPPTLRPAGPMSNDLTPAAVSLLPELADWMVDLSRRWERGIMMSGSGPACFAYFLDEDEAESALGGLAEHRAAKAAALRPRGIAPC